MSGREYSAIFKYILRSDTMATYIIYDKYKADEGWQGTSSEEVKKWFQTEEDKDTILQDLAWRDIQFGTIMEESGLDDQVHDIVILEFLFEVFLPTVEIINIEEIPTDVFIRLFESLSKEKLHTALQGIDISLIAKEGCLPKLRGMSEDYILEYLFALRPLAKKLKEEGGELIMLFDSCIEDQKMLARAEEHYKKFLG